MEAFLQTYGYWAILMGTFLEGETTLVLGGLAAFQGYLDLAGVIATGFLGGFSGDQLFFYLGRRHGGYFIERHPAWQSRLQRADILVDRYQTLLILGFRFLYGLRSIIPFAIGISAIPAIRFVSLSMVGAAVWSVVVGGGGYLFGHAVEGLIGDIRRYEILLFTLVASAGGLVWVLKLVARSKQ